MKMVPFNEIRVPLTADIDGVSTKVNVHLRRCSVIIDTHYELSQMLRVWVSHHLCAAKTCSFIKKSD